ncbi:MAG: Kelch repeat-containing protein [Bdellovibrionales bacterium]
MLLWSGSLGDFRVVNFDPATDTFTRSGATNPPGNIGVYTAIWTGSKMIIWGGFSLSGTTMAVVNDGAAYDPLTDSWTKISSVGAPSPRAYATAIWTGSKMIVWGGNSYPNFEVKGDGGIYDPKTDSWTTLNSDGAPSPRNAHTAVWTGTGMIIWGGNTYDGTHFSELNDGAVFDPENQSWTQLTQSGNLPHGRSGHVAVWTGSKMIIWGGSVKDGSGVFPDAYGTTFLSDGWIFDPKTQLWTRMKSGPLSARYRPASVWTGSEMILIGGLINQSSLPADGAIYK